MPAPRPSAPARAVRVATASERKPRRDQPEEDRNRSSRPAKPGAPFVLKPRGGPKVKMTIDELRPHLLVDTAHLLGAKMRTTHEYEASGGRTTIHFRVEVWGPLGFFWRKVVGEGQIKGAPAQLAAFVAYARRAGA